jgi:hypothetical protein
LKVKIGAIGIVVLAVLMMMGAALLTGAAERRDPATMAALLEGRACRHFGLALFQEPSPPKLNSRDSGQGTTRREEDKGPADPSQYSYEFNQPAFYIHHILIEHNAHGEGKITFERLGENTPIVEPLKLSSAAIGRILGFWRQLGFLDSNENYQSAKQFPHLGTMRLHMENGDHQRTAEFNWTNNKDAAALNKEYHRVADQAMFIVDMSIARENQPLNTPKLMEQLESLLTSGGLSDPLQLVPLLHDLTTDEHIPLIARNHATRLLKRLEK